MLKGKSLQETPAFQHLARVIQSGNCVLFLGAGVSLDSGAPSGAELARELSARFFPNEGPNSDFGTVCEAVDANYSRQALNELIIERFCGPVPRGALLSIPLYHWKSIYTVNFDTLLEEAYAQGPGVVQKLHPFYSDKDAVTHLGPDEVALYKLHGCLSRPNSREGRLTLTPDDIALVGESRQRLLNRLLDDASDYAIFYVGFARADRDFRDVLLNVARAAGHPSDLRRGYALQPGFSASQVAVWDAKKVTLIDAKAADFFETLDASIIPGERYVAATPAVREVVLSLERRSPKVTAALLRDIERNFEVVDERIADQPPNTEDFFSGAQPNWGLIAAATDAERDLKDEVLTAVLRDHHLDRGGVQCVLIHAEAGSGKTTLLRRVGVDLATTWQQIVLSAMPFGTLDFLALERLAAAVKERIYVLIDDATSVARDLGDLLAAARRAKTRLTIIATARTNEWRELQADFGLDGFEEFELSSLSRVEILRILATLEGHNALGFLSGLSEEAQIAAFETRANKQLLVALREATEGKNFDAIIVDEYDRIPSDIGRRAYLLVASLYRFGILTRAGLLHRALKIPLKDIGRRVLNPTTKVIVAQVPLGEADVYYTTRHPLIAEIVFDRKVVSERLRLEFYQDLINSLDLGYSSDADAFRKLTRGKNKQLLRDFRSASDRRDLMLQLLKRDPTDPFALQHAAMMELDERNLESALKYLHEAIALAPQDPSIRDTEGRLSMLGAVEEENPFLAEDKFARTEQIFKRNIDRRPDEQIGYRHLAETYLRWSERKTDDQERLKYIGLAYDTLQRGRNRCLSGVMLLQLQAEIEQKEFANPDKARKIFAEILTQKPGDLASRFLAARLEEREGRPLDALALLVQGLDLSRYDPQLHFRIARLMVETETGSDQEIRSHFDAALLGPIRDIRPRLTYAAYLFSQGDYQRAANEFAQLDQLDVSRAERNEVHRFSFGQLKARHQGRVTRVAYSAGAVEFGRGAVEVYFAPRQATKSVRESLQVGLQASFEIGFNLRGPIALNLRLVDWSTGKGAAAGAQLQLPLAATTKSSDVA